MTRPPSRPLHLPLTVSLLALCALAIGCSTVPVTASNKVPATPTIPAQWRSSLAITDYMIPAGKFARWRMTPMRPTHITVHSTANYARGATAERHAQGLRKGGLKGEHNALGYLAWHFTIDDHSVYQSLPCNETGEHADYDGPGNRKSVGIEMCENRDGDFNKTLDRTARFVAVLMKEYGIPLNHVVPHYHWHRVRHDDGKVLGHKACPGPLMTNGKPGPKWDAFVRSVARYRSQI
ncbi:hypothetical protein BH23VER1_BH23VER1_21220 [soil metagenome]